jgi:hypothetical protein
MLLPIGSGNAINVDRPPLSIDRLLHRHHQFADVRFTIPGHQVKATVVSQIGTSIGAPPRALDRKRDSEFDAGLGLQRRRQSDACTRVLTSIMSAKLFSWARRWHNKSCLEETSSAQLPLSKWSKLTRAHLSPRIDTVLELLRRDKPLSEREFIEYWLTHDRTVICAKTIVRSFNQIKNEDALLFSSNSVAWKHRKAERDLLKTL